MNKIFFRIRLIEETNLFEVVLGDVTTQLTKSEFIEMKSAIQAISSNYSGKQDVEIKNVGSLIGVDSYQLIFLKDYLSMFDEATNDNN